jgi:hypothetical protein
MFRPREDSTELTRLRDGIYQHEKPHYELMLTGDGKDFQSSTPPPVPTNRIIGFGELVQGIRQIIETWCPGILIFAVIVIFVMMLIRQKIQNT